VSLLNDLVWYWDLTSADATITDQHSGLALPKVGTVTTDAIGGPDGGPCIDVGVAAGKYRAVSVSKTISYDDGYTINIWAYSAGTSSTFNALICHRNVGGGAPFYFQMVARNSLDIPNVDYGLTFDAVPNFRVAAASQFALNQWQMLTLVDTGTVTTLYRNGVSVATSSTSLGTRSTAAANFAIGGASWASGAAIDHRGKLAKAGVWNVPLDAALITNLYNGGAGRNYADLDAGGGIIPILRQHYAAQGAR
jgi:hypothetical protein